jgi:hypothetical protein
MFHQLYLSKSTFCPHSAFMNFVWVSEQTAIFPYSTLITYNRGGVCLLRGTSCMYTIKVKVFNDVQVTNLYFIWCVRKTAKSDYSLRHVLPSTQNNSAPTRRICMKFHI